MHRHHLAAVVTAAVLLAGCLHAAAGTAPPDLRLYAMDCGTLTLADADAYADDGAYKSVARTLVVPCYLIRHRQGDMWHLAESRAARRVPRFNFDRAETLRSMDKVEALARETNARVVRQHVPEDFEALLRFPQPLR